MIGNMPIGVRFALRADTRIEEISKELREISIRRMLDKKALGLFRSGRIEGQPEPLPAPSIEYRTHIFIQSRGKGASPVTLLPDHTLKGLQPRVFPVFFDPPGEDIGEFFIPGPSSELQQYGLLTGGCPLENRRILSTRIEEACQPACCVRKQGIADERHRNDGPFNIHEHATNHSPTLSVLLFKAGFGVLRDPTGLIGEHSDGTDSRMVAKIEPVFRVGGDGNQIPLFAEQTEYLIG